MDTIRAFFPQNQGTFFDFQKRAGEASPPPHLVARMLYIQFNNFKIELSFPKPFLNLKLVPSARLILKSCKTEKLK